MAADDDSSHGVTHAVRGTETLALRLLHPDSDATRAVAAVASELSRGGGMWLGLSALAATSSRTRTAGRDGIVAWATASVAAFGLKRAVHRPRPRRVPRIGSDPTSSSMPSSQAAAAVAYATAATWQTPASALLTVPLALAVAWSRAATGRHFPTDIAAGAALGLITGAAAHLALHRQSNRPPKTATSSRRAPRASDRADDEARAGGVHLR
jgi:membrane-associated phospholipid phosphatase